MTSSSSAIDGSALSAFTSCLWLYAPKSPFLAWSEAEYALWRCCLAEKVEGDRAEEEVEVGGNVTFSGLVDASMIRRRWLMHALGC